MTFGTRVGRTAYQALPLDLTLINSCGARTLIG